MIYLLAIFGSVSFIYRSVLAGNHFYLIKPELRAPLNAMPICRVARPGRGSRFAGGLAWTAGERMRQGQLARGFGRDRRVIFGKLPASSAGRTGRRARAAFLSLQSGLLSGSGQTKVGGFVALYTFVRFRMWASSTRE